jgi:PAS domain S-box-containing protein
MAKHSSGDQKVARELSEMRIRLSEAEDTLDAIRSGSVDALVVRTPRGEQLFTLKGADQTYRALVEAMNEGALALNNGMIAYCNHHFSKMVHTPLEKVLGTSIFDWVHSPEFRPLLQALQKGRRERGSVEAVLRGAEDMEVPVLLSASRYSSEGRAAVCLVVTDITERKNVERVRRELSRSILNAQEGERKRVARDLHDSVNQLLSSAKFRLNPLSSGAELNQARELIEKAIGEVRLISRNLRPSELDDIGLPAALRSLAHDFEKRSGIDTRVRNRACRSLPVEVDMALYRITQEALNNVEKHSGATRAEVSLVCTNDEAQLTIRDNGSGFAAGFNPETARGWGLKNMRERAALLGGSLALSSVRSKGMRISICIPLSKQSNGKRL